MPELTYAAGFADGPWRVLLSYNAQNGRLQEVVGDNQSAVEVKWSARDLTDGDVFSGSFLPRRVTRFAVPAGRITCVVFTDPEFPESPALMQRDVAGELQPLPVSISVVGG